MAGPRVYAAMAADRALPRALAKHNDRGVPQLAVITQAVLACMFVMVGDPDILIRFVGFTLAIFAGLAVVAVYVLRARGMAGEYRTWGYPVTPVIFILSSVWIAIAQVKERPFESLVIAVVLGTGGLVYYLTTRGKPPPPAELPKARVVDDK
jgi:APA family basic amino acid/polyamine antiporter